MPNRQDRARSYTARPTLSTHGREKKRRDTCSSMTRLHIFLVHYNQFFFTRSRFLPFLVKDVSKAISSNFILCHLTGMTSMSAFGYYQDYSLLITSIFLRNNPVFMPPPGELPRVSLFSPTMGNLSAKRKSRQS